MVNYQIRIAESRTEGDRVQQAAMLGSSDAKTPPGLAILDTIDLPEELTPFFNEIIRGNQKEISRITRDQLAAIIALTSRISYDVGVKRGKESHEL